MAIGQPSHNTYNFILRAQMELTYGALHLHSNIWPRKSWSSNLAFKFQM